MHRSIPYAARGASPRVLQRTAMLAAGMACIQGPALATTAAGAPRAGQPDQLQEVVVTAQKRRQSLEKVPISVQVVQGRDLAADNTTTFDTLAQSLPDVHIVNTGGPANTLNVRGIGSGQGNPAFDQSVAMFVDDIYEGRSHMIAQTFLDLDRIEVLKGPQSTFFGNNAIAGALSVVTAKPGNHFEASLRTLYGSYGQFAVEGAVGGPVTDTVGVRLAGTYNGQSGWITNTDTGQKAPNEHNLAGRLTTTFHPVDDFDATAMIEESRNKISGTTSDTPFQWTNCPPPPPLKAGSPVLYNGSVNKFCGAAIAAGDPLGLNNDLDAGLAGQYALLKTNLDVLTANYRKWGATFTSVSGYYGYDYSADADQARVGLQVLQATYTPEKYHQLSQEFRVTSPSGRPVEWMLGIYYQHDNVTELVDGNAAYTNAYIGTVLPAAFAPYAPLQYWVGYSQREQVESTFGSLSWNVTHSLKLNAGLRATWGQKYFDGTLLYGTATQTYGGPYTPLPPAIGANPRIWLLGVPGSYPDSRHDSGVMPSGGIQYQVTPEAMLYATYSRGFKAGGFNGILAAAGSAGADLGFGPEHVDAYEAGIKSKWLDNRALLNLDVFRMNYSGLQVNSLVQLTPANQSIEVKNAATSLSQGVELESEWLMTARFHLALDLSYLEAHYVKYPNAAPDFLQNLAKLKSQDLSGKPMDFAPKWSANLRAEYRVELPGDYMLTAALSPFFESWYFNSNGTDDPITRIGGHVRWDGMLTLDSADGHWAVDVIGKNLANRVIPIAQTNNFGAKEEPRTVAAQLRLRW